MARRDDGCDYPLKYDAKHPKTMRSEWSCSQLAEAKADLKVFSGIQVNRCQRGAFHANVQRVLDQRPM